MFRCCFEGIEKINQYEELIKVFLMPGQYEICSVSSENAKSLSEVDANGFHIYRFDGDKDGLKRELYRDLSKYTGKSPKWGILTGIRPVKLAGEISDNVGKTLREKYLLHESKVKLITDILKLQRSEVGLPEKNSVSIYIGIPFCPTRCLYCSFTSNQVSDSEIERYLEALKREIEYAGQNLRKSNMRIESIYIGGGTPTTLSESQLENILQNVKKAFGIEAGSAAEKNLKEFTVEAGRPDTITPEKLKTLKKLGVDRISINPQSMKQETLDLIGRKHTAASVKDSFNAAREAGINIINTDLIAGLPGESLDDFKSSLSDIISLGAENITLHTLAVKRASKLKELDGDYNYRNEELREQMLEFAFAALTANGYRPYYLYRQKHTSGNTENIGYCRGNTPSVYNIRIMEEAQSILALGAGGISKVYFADENRLERVPNVSNYEIYIDRIEEMIDRKNRGFFIG